MEEENENDPMGAVDFTKIFFTDINGRLMNLFVNPLMVDKMSKTGVGFDGSSIAGYTSVENSDRLLVPSLSTYNEIDFGDKTVGFLIGDIYDEKGNPSGTDPRHLLKKVLKKAEKEFQVRFTVGPEHEFFLFNGESAAAGTDPEMCVLEHSDDIGYFVSSPTDKGESVRQDIVNVLAGCGIQYEKTHHEVTPSQHEINLECTDALSAADRTLLFSYVAKQVAEKNGFTASFMPKPFENYNRNAFHIHLSMQDFEGNNLFYDATSEHQLSDLARYFIGGILKYARETSIIMASTVNSYKAYVMGKEAPVVRGWGLRNRSSMVRVPYTLSPESTRIELRNPDPAGNVYLQMAVLISMGLAGMREKLDCGMADKGSSYNKEHGLKVWDDDFLPRSFYEALVEAEDSSFLKETMGEAIYKNMMTLKLKEWEEDRVHVTQREHNKYRDV
ncbi:glutamine synthetase [Desulfocicer vacuolatum DSM 3385]|uniref:Glutamine synthetase n=1 Tax=Desulfocicer vacuolatum DSM 3385 TaxID=1121400 RepID=A0A1W2DXX3_9BACT|nr:glutamine synthetase [Desulfocicer vacuolatum DSM 3385]